MRILQAHKYFYRRAGAEAVLLDTIIGLKARGHEVVEFSVANTKNLPSEYSSYFINIEPELTGIKYSAFTSWKIFKHLISSKEVDAKLSALVMAAEPQVAHLHNVSRQMSATTFITLKKLKIPIIMTVHDVQPMCPNHRMITKHELCERCFCHKYYNCALHKCIDNSRAKSLAGMIEAYYYYLRRVWSLVDIFICPSQFMLDKMTEWGFPKSKLRLARNPQTVPADCPPLGKKIVYLGRLHEEKGIRVFMNAIRQLRQYQVVVAGDGPDEELVERNIRQYGLNNVELIGRVQGEKWREAMLQAKVVVVPSMFYENCSMTVLEALSYGRIVVAADRGGNSELITNGETGFLAEAENSDSFVTFIREAMELKSEEAQEIANNGRRLVMDNHNVDGYFKKLEEVYEEVVKL